METNKQSYIKKDNYEILSDADLVMAVRMVLGEKIEKRKFEKLLNFFGNFLKEPLELKAEFDSFCDMAWNLMSLDSHQLQEDETYIIASIRGFLNDLILLQSANKKM